MELRALGITVQIDDLLQLAVTLSNVIAILVAWRRKRIAPPDTPQQTDPPGTA
ncbi:hypothetical protein [Streptomyces sp. NPDC047061]|uniref:hypothetical protein n=1 Tax=unclassified Streptomyces TaxID=2593676 RepID=UPI0033D97841